MPLLLDLSNGIALIDAADAHLITGKTLYKGTNGYIYYSIWENGKSTPHTLHALICGSTPGQHIDHRNGDKTDNRRANLRVVSPQTNQANRKRLNRNNTSGHRGVVCRRKLKRPWVAQIMVNRKTIYLGSYETPELATEARRLAEIEYYGEECPR